ncbi:MAG: hypothetical protein LBE13_07080, partial [Bacteroidales bacterium]|nr:hypothetical protein [Bacteroidales bacterium]
MWAKAHGFLNKSCKMLRILPFSAEVVQKLRFLNNSIDLATMPWYHHVSSAVKLFFNFFQKTELFYPLSNRRAPVLTGRNIITISANCKEKKKKIRVHA